MIIVRGLEVFNFWARLYFLNIMVRLIIVVRCGLWFIIFMFLKFRKFSSVFNDNLRKIFFKNSCLSFIIKGNVLLDEFILESNSIFVNIIILILLLKRDFFFIFN